MCMWDSAPHLAHGISLHASWVWCGGSRYRGEEEMLRYSLSYTHACAPAAVYDTWYTTSTGSVSCADLSSPW